MAGLEGCKPPSFEAPPTGRRRTSGRRGGFLLPRHLTQRCIDAVLPTGAVFSIRSVTVSFTLGKGTDAVLCGPSSGLVVAALKAFSAAARASGSRRVFGVSRQSLDRSRESSLPMA
jgi:hypothetical protein